jgi:uncharacterized protein (TIGR00725 family)
MHIAVFGSSTTPPTDPWYASGLELGAAIAVLGLDVATGGYGGMMEAVSRGASQAGGRVIGVTSPELFPHRSGPNPWVDVEIPARTIAERIGALLDGATAVVAMPGALGTLTELVVAWNVFGVLGPDHLPICAVGDGWAEFVARYADRLGAPPLTTVDTTTDAIRWLTHLQGPL